MTIRELKKILNSIDDEEGEVIIGYTEEMDGSCYLIRKGVVDTVKGNEYKLLLVIGEYV